MADSSPTQANEKPQEPPPLRSVHTNTFAQILHVLGASLAVTTYQAGKLVLLRPEPRADGPVLNTHFRAFHRPMGFAWERGRFALGTTTEIWEFHDLPAVASKLDTPESPARHDAAFLPRTTHHTGDVQVHEMVWVPPDAGSETLRRPGSLAHEKPGSSPIRSDIGVGLSELWFVNTRFSCLATRSDIYSFVPRWMPPFVTSLAPEDRCHLNGLALRDGQPRYVTALGETDKPGGWRENKPAGGCVIDVRSNQTIARGLSMPHSPRWHNGQLWVLESGNGGVGVIDQANGKYREICRLPGFTRGFDFAGPYAFIGLSQVRESAVFSGITIAEMKQEDRCCGVWAIDTRTGQTVGFVKFLDAVQEVFAVQVLNGIRWPEVLSEDTERLAQSYELPPAALRMVPEQLVQRTGQVEQTK
ncbi:MAG TPA: TIGR03032 family protein [Tepidisphaeraceae bacterium]|nr:TIGR03032 family protein [Tepidisphaeraceae bacterium]